MKYSLTFISILAGVAFAQDAALLTSLGFPQCSVKCIQEGNKAAQDQVGCGLTDVACQCGKGYTILQTAITNCVLKTTPCSDTDQNKIQPAGDALCAQFAGGTSSSGTSSSPSSSGGHAGMSMGTSGSTAPKTTNAPQASNFVSTSGARTSSKAATGGAAAATTSSKAIAAPDRTMAAGLLGLAGAAAALAL